MQAIALPDYAVSEVLAILLKHQPLRTDEGHLIDPETWEQFSPLKQHVLQDVRITSAVDSFLNGVARHRTILRRERNNASPIHRLPDEILACIFEALVEDRFGSEGMFDIVVTLVQVTSRWRNVALSTVRLWSSLESHYCESLVTASITRSRNAPLHLFISTYGLVEEIAFLQLMLPHVARWETFNCDSRHYRKYSSYLEEMDNQLPLLKRFQVTGAWADEVLVPYAVSHHAPLLESLVVVSFSLPVEAPLFSGLRVIEFSPVIDNKPLSSEQWHCLLASSPNLEDIHAEGKVRSSQGPLVPFQVSLPRLETFRLSYIHSLMVSLLLSAIPLNEDRPPCIEIRYAWEYDDDGHHFEILFPHSSIRSTLLSSIHRMTSISSCSYNNGTDLIIHAGMNSQPDLFIYAGLDIPVSDMYRTVVPRSVFPNLKEIDLGGWELFGDGTFSSTLHLCTSLERLSIRNPDCRGQINNFRSICNRLAKPIVSPTDERVSYTGPCPNLKYLAFEIYDADLSPLVSSMTLRYPDDLWSKAPGDAVVHLEELRLSSKADLPSLLRQDEEFLSMIRVAFIPFGTVVRIVHGMDFYKRDWSV